MELLNQAIDLAIAICLYSPIWLMAFDLCKKAYNQGNLQSYKQEVRSNLPERYTEVSQLAKTQTNRDLATLKQYRRTLSELKSKYV